MYAEVHPGPCPSHPPPLSLIEVFGISLQTYSMSPRCQPVFIAHLDRLLHVDGATGHTSTYRLVHACVHRRKARDGYPFLAFNFPGC